MTINDFWNIIELGQDIKNSCEETDELIESHLKTLSNKELISYQKIFTTLWNDAYRWDLWRVAYIVEGGCGDDNFMDFRASLISFGREVYENTLRNSDSFAFFSSLDKNVTEDRIYNESFINLAVKVYEERSSNDIYDEFEFLYTDEPLGEKIDWEDEDIEAKLKCKYPNLMEMYW